MRHIHKWHELYQLLPFMKSQTSDGLIVLNVPIPTIATVLSAGRLRYNRIFLVPVHQENILIRQTCDFQIFIEPDHASTHQSSFQEQLSKQTC